MSNNDFHHHINDRRQRERRTNPHPFNSPEWVAVMTEQFLLWPKQDRRKIAIGNYERRSIERRNQTRVLRLNVDKMKRYRKQNTASQITDEEMQYILDVFKNE